MAHVGALGRWRLLGSHLSTVRPRRPPSYACAATLSLRGPRAGGRAFRSTAWLAEERRDGAEKASAWTAVNGVKDELRGDEASKILSEVAFAFDIDGVLYRGKDKIPGAAEVLRKIRSMGARYVFLTNGGGTTERVKAAALHERLGVPENEDVFRDRVIQSHTPFQGWDESVKQGETVFITGTHPEKARQIAREYGFKRAVTPADIVAARREIYPFHLVGEDHNLHAAGLPDGKKLYGGADPYSEDIPPSALKIDQVMIWNDPRDWSLDIQLIHDILISHKGYLGTISGKNGDTSLPNRGWQQDGQPDVWVSNLDLLWKTEYPINRFGTGAFVEALKGVWSAATGGAELQFNALGKPSQATYEYAHDRLLHYYADMAAARQRAKSPAGGDGDSEPRAAPHRLRRVYMIGDNPESDIRGALEFQPADGTPWTPILVRTGVWEPTAAARRPSYEPAATVDDVVDAVAWALRSEGLSGATREWLLDGGTGRPGRREAAADGKGGYPSDVEALGDVAVGGER